jgi:hypothetical protein
MDGSMSVVMLFVVLVVKVRKKTESERNKSTLQIGERFFFFPVALRPNVGQGLLILGVSRSNTTTHHSW